MLHGTTGIRDLERGKGVCAFSGVRTGPVWTRQVWTLETEKPSRLFPTDDARSTYSVMAGAQGDITYRVSLKANQFPSIQVTEK